MSERVVLIQFSPNGKHPWHMVTLEDRPRREPTTLFYDIDSDCQGQLVRHCSGVGGDSYLEGDGPYWAEKGYRPKSPGRTKTRRKPRGRYSPERILDVIPEVDGRGRPLHKYERGREQ